MSVLYSLYRFFTSTRFTLEQFSIRWLSILQVWSVFYILVITYTLLLTYIAPGLMETMQPVKLQEFVFGENTIFIVALTVIIWPLMEELLFRAGMKRWWRNVSFLLWALLFWFIKYILNDYFLSLGLSQFYLSLAVYTLYGVCVLTVFHVVKPRLSSISRIYTRFSWWIFRSLTLLFGLVHLSNFSFTSRNWSLVLLIIPQIILGVMLGFVRMNWWLSSSIALHMFHNLIQLIPLLILKQLVWPHKDILTYIPNMSSTDLLSNPWSIVSWLYGGILFVVIAWNIIKEIQWILRTTTSPSME